MHKDFTKFRKEFSYIAFMIPALIIYTVLTVFPLFRTIHLSFSDWNGYNLGILHFVGFKNYAGIFQDQALVAAIKNTMLYAVANPLLVTVLAIPLALVLNCGMKTTNFQRAAFFFPSVPSALVLGYLWSYIMSPMDYGVLNRFFGLFGISPVLWLADQNMAMVSVIIVSVWNCVGWHACIYIAQLQSIPTDYYEAAKIDGASALQQFHYITLPMLRPAMTISVMLLLVNAFKVFDLPFALTSGGPGYSTTFLSQIIIQKSFVEKQYGTATAASVLFFVCMSAISFAQMHIMKKREEN